MFHNLLKNNFNWIKFSNHKKWFIQFKNLIIKNKSWVEKEMEKEQKKGWEKKNQLNSSLFSEPYHLNLCMENKKLVVPVWLHSCSKNFCFAYVVKELNSTKTTFAPLNKQLKRFLLLLCFKELLKLQIFPIKGRCSSFYFCLST